MKKYDKAIDALKFSKKKSWLNTEQKLNEALERIRSGKPLIVEMQDLNFNNTSPPITLICREAKVNQSGVYQHHRKWLESLKRATKNSRKTAANPKLEKNELVQKLETERNLTRQLEADKDKLAKLNYSLARSNEALLGENARIRNKLEELTRQLNRKA